MTSRESGRRRVLFLIGQMGFGGSEGQLRLLLEHLDDNRWETHVLVYHSSPNSDHTARLRAAGVEVSVMPDSIRGPFRKLAFTSKTVRRILPDIIHSWTVHDNPYAALAGWPRRSRLRWGSLRGSTSLPGFRSLPRWYRHLALRSVQRLVVNSQALRLELIQSGVEEDRILVLPNCVAANPRLQAEGRSWLFEEMGFSEDNAVFGNVGNIRRVKNQLLFVRAMATVITRHPEARGVIVGETLAGEEATRSEIDREIESLRLSGKVILSGFRPDMDNLIPHLTALCMTSDSEGMPNVVLEAMAAGVPVVATAVGGVPDVVRDRKTGYLVARGDATACAEAMLKIVDEPEEACRMAAAAESWVMDQRSCSAMARRLEDAYGETLGMTPQP